MAEKPQNPHFAFPFARGSHVEQDTEQHVMSCLEVIARCPVGFRIERPDFGIPWLEYRTTLDPSSSIEDALLELEPRVDMTSAVFRDWMMDLGEEHVGEARVVFEVEVDGG